MNNIIIKEQSEEITITTDNIQTDNYLQVECINTDLTYSILYDDYITGETLTELNKDLFQFSYTLPDYDCIIIFRINQEITYCGVGNNTLKNIFFYISTDNFINNTIPSYVSITPIGEFIESGEFTQLNNDIYYYIINSDNDYCIIEVDNIIYNLTPIEVLNISTDGYMSGEYIIQPNRFQMIAIPRANSTIQYFIDLVQDSIAKDNTFDDLSLNQIIKLTKAYPSNPESFNRYQVYVPEVSNDAAKFNLMQEDNDKMEIVPFFIETGDFQNDFIIKWEN